MTLTIQSAMRKDISTGKSVSLQHRHFAFIAAVLAETKPIDSGSFIQWEQTVAAFAKACSRTNPNFDLDRFVRACGE